MKFIKQDLLTLLIGLFLFSACKSTNTIGITPDEGYGIKGELKVLAVNSSTVTDEPTNTTSQPRYPLGFISGDPIFGSTEAELAVLVALPSNGYSFGSDPIVDSAVLVLPYYVPADSSRAEHIYGDTTTSTYAFTVQQLQEDLSLQKSFLSNKEWAVKPDVVGSFAAKIRPNTRPKITDIVPGKADTVRQVPTPQIRIRLDNAFIQNNILNLDSATRSKNSKFAGAFKGLKISIDKTKSVGPGGIVFLNFSSSDELARANVAIYYKKLTDNSLVLRDTASVYFPISTAVSPFAAASTIRHNYTGTPVKTQLDAPNPATPYAVTYIQALAGLRNKISIPDIKTFTDSVRAKHPTGRIVINKAELVVNISNGTDVAPNTPNERLALYRLDIAGQRVNLTDNLPGVGNIANPRYAGSAVAYGGYYDKKNKRYVFTVTGYLQELIDGTTQDYGTYLAPSAYTEFNLTPPVASAERSVIPTKAHGAGEKAIKLNIYYTIAD
jgi:hypothetical protein